MKSGFEHLLRCGGEGKTIISHTLFLAGEYLMIVIKSVEYRAKIEDINVSPAKHRFLCNTLKEGISNGLRHGNATAFWFELKTEEGKIRFYLSDNGTGLATENFESGFGLTTMRDRVRALGGDMYIMSEPDEGFELNIVLPADEIKDRTGEDKKND